MKNKRNKYTVGIVCSTFIFVIVVLIIKRYYPNKLVEIYNFDSGYLSEKTEVESTQPIKLPKYLCRAERVICTNQTIYDICIFSDSEGFKVLSSGEQLIVERPVTFLLASNSGNNLDELEGEFILHKYEKNLTSVFSFQPEDIHSVVGKYFFKYKIDLGVKT